MLFRIISSLVIVPSMLGLMYYYPAGFRFFIIAVLLIGYDEYRRIMQGKGLRFSPWPGCFALLALLLPTALGTGNLPILLDSFLARSGSLPLALYFILVASWNILWPDPERGLERFWAELAGLVYLGLLGLQVVKLNALPMGFQWTLLIFWYAWVYDSGALFIGKPFGKTKFNALSPGKTWEGFWGGIVFNIVLSGTVLPLVFPANFPLNGWQLALLSIPASLMAQSGDLFESMLKRFAGVKDSSHLISKHGGFLDKMDSSLFVAPVLYLAAMLVGAL